MQLFLNDFIILTGFSLLFQAKPQNDITIFLDSYVIY